MLCPRCGSKIKKGKICKVCAFQLEEEVSKKNKFKIIDVFRIILTIFFLYYGYQLLVFKNILLALISLLVILLIFPTLRNKIKILDKLNNIVKSLIIIVVFFLVGMYGNESKIQNINNDFINKYKLEDEFSEIGINDIQSIKVIYQDNHPDYPSIDFELTNEKGATYSGLITGDKDGKYELLSFTKYEEGIRKEYYATASDFDENNKLTIDLYDYKTDDLKKKKETIDKTILQIKIRSGENNEYAISMPFESGSKYFYKLPENKQYRVSRKAVNDKEEATSYIWQDYDEKNINGNSVEYKNYEKYEFENDDSIVYINVIDNTHLDLTGDYIYTFELYE